MVRYISEGDREHMLQLREALRAAVSTPFELVTDVVVRSSAKADENVLRVLLEWPYLHPSWVPVLMQAFVDGKLRVDLDGDVWVRGRFIMNSELADKTRK